MPSNKIHKWIYFSRVKLQYEFTPGYINNKVKLMLNRAPIPALGMSDYSVCAALENKYPPFSKEFLGFDMNQDLKVQFGKFHRFDMIIKWNFF